MSIRNCGELGTNLKSIINRLLANQNLCKLLYYTGQDPLSGADIENTRILYQKQILIIPKYNPVEEDYSVVSLVVQNGARDVKNDEFRDFLLRFYIYVPNTKWIIVSDNLRPFAIIGELENSLSNKKINGLGTLKAGDISIAMFTEQMTGYYIDFYITDFI